MHLWVPGFGQAFPSRTGSQGQTDRAASPVTGKGCPWHPGPSAAVSRSRRRTAQGSFLSWATESTSAARVTVRRGPGIRPRAAPGAGLWAAPPSPHPRRRPRGRSACNIRIRASAEAAGRPARSAAGSGAWSGARRCVAAGLPLAVAVSLTLGSSLR